jgi:hypothetical protein
MQKRSELEERARIRNDALIKLRIQRGDLDYTDVYGDEQSPPRDIIASIKKKPFSNKNITLE